MFEVGQKVSAKKAAMVFWENAPDVLVVKNVEEDGRFISLVGHPRNGESQRDHTRDWYISADLFKPHTETEAERRGAKFGVTGIVKDKGFRVSFVKEHNGFWRVFDESGMDYDFKSSEIRLDHEPEFVAWVDAPEHLRYDASRVYFDGKPVKWIAKPEGCYGSDVVFVAAGGCLRCGTFSLTVKL